MSEKVDVKEKKPSAADLQKAVAFIMEKRINGFERRFEILDTGVTVEVGEDYVVSVVGVGEIVSAVTTYLNRLGHSIGIADLPIAGIRQAVDYWENSAKRIPADSIRPFLWKNSEDSLCWRRLPFNYTPTASEREYPLWIEIIGRIKETGNRAAFTHWIGSIFEEDSYLQQFLWLFGDGLNGKSSVSRVLQRMMGPAATGGLVPARNIQEEKYNLQLVGKRLGVFADCNEPGYTTTDKFKRLTGGEALPARYHHKETFEFKMNAKILFISNVRPELSSLAADTRRPIICTLAPADVEAFAKYQPGTDYENELFKQLGAFASAAHRQYVEAYGKGAIDVANEIEDYGSLREEIYQEIFDKYFIIDPDSAVPRKQVLKMLSEEFRTLHEQQRFRAWMLRVYPVENKYLPAHLLTKYMQTRGVKGYVGMRVNADSMLRDFKVVKADVRVVD
jgi:hypothetical protein